MYASDLVAAIFLSFHHGRLAAGCTVILSPNFNVYVKGEIWNVFHWNAKMLLICKPIAACETTCKVMTAKF